VLAVSKQITKNLVILSLKISSFSSNGVTEPVNYSKSSILIPYFSKDIDIHLCNTKHTDLNQQDSRNACVCLTGSSILLLPALISEHYSAGDHSNNKTKRKTPNESETSNQNL